MPHAAILDQIDAIVNGELILASEVDEQISLLMDTNQFAALNQDQRAEVRRRSLEQLISQYLIAQEVKRILPADQLAKIRKDSERLTDMQIKRFQSQFASPDEMVKEEQRVGMTWDEIRTFRLPKNEREFIARTIFPKLVQVRVNLPTALEVEQFKSDYPSIQPTGKIKIAHILLRLDPNASADEEAQVRQRMNDILLRARAGENFEALVQEFSEDQNTVNSGGELPEFNQGELFTEFDVAFDLNVGDVSDPIRTSRGYHIIKVIGKETMEKIVYEHKLGQKMKTWLDDIRSRAKIDIKQKLAPSSLPQ
jgi:peptidyl-prolyl cis-trans isomerase C